MNQNKYVEEITKKLNIVDVVREYLPGLKKAGRNYKALCPFHSEKTPSFTVSEEKQMFYCFGCGEGGNMFNFVMKMENLTFFEAVKKLALKAGVHIDESKGVSLTLQDKEKITLRKIMDEATFFFQRFLNSSSGREALSYLKTRNLKDETIRNFLIGLSPDSQDALHSELKKKFEIDLILKSGLARVREDGKIVDSFIGRLMFPIRDYNGGVIGFGARSLGSEGPKYINSSETPLFSKRRVLYGLYESLPEIRKNRKVLVVEGYMDVIVLHQYGINFAVSPLGTSFGFEQIQLIKRYCDESFILFDPDVAGINSALKAGETMIEKGLYPRICTIKQNMDPDEFIIKEGVDEFLKLLKNSMDIIDFKISLIKDKKADIKTYEKAKIISYLLSTVNKQSDDIIKNEWLKKISENFGIGENILLNYMKKNTNKREEGEIKINLSSQEIPIIEQGFIHFLLREPHLINFIPNFKVEFLRSDFAKAVFSYIEEKKESFKLEELCDLYPQYSSLILRLCMEEVHSNISSSVNIRKAAAMVEDAFCRERWKYLKENLSSLTSEELKEFSNLTKKVKTERKTDII